jgi:hypothetical protein
MGRQENAQRKAQVKIKLAEKYEALAARSGGLVKCQRLIRRATGYRNQATEIIRNG